MVNEDSVNSGNVNEGSTGVVLDRGAALDRGAVVGRSAGRGAVLTVALMLGLMAGTGCGGDDDVPLIDGGSDSDGATPDASALDGGVEAGTSDGGSGDGGPSDGGSTDGGSTDGGSTDGSSSDSAIPWPDAAAPSDGSVPSDGGASDGGASDGGASDGGASDGGGTGGEVTDLSVLWGRPLGEQASPASVRGAVVTYVRAALAPDPAGVFVQAASTGPAVFVTAPLDAVSVGDVLDFEVTELSDLNGMRVVSGLTAPAGRTIVRLMDGPEAAAALVQDLTSDATVGLDPQALAGEYVTARVTVEEARGEIDESHEAFQISNEVTYRSNVQLRIPTSLAAARGLSSWDAAGCVLDVGPAPMWRTQDELSDVLYFSVYESSQVRAVSCPAPRVVGAVAPSPREVRVSFSRPLAAVSVQPGDFTISALSGGAALPVAAADLQPDGKEVRLTLGADLEGLTYVVTVADVSDLTTGAGLGAAPDDRASFVPSETPLHLSEYVIGGSGVALEVFNPGTTAARLDTCRLEVFAGGAAPPVVVAFDPGALPPGATLTVCSEGAGFVGRCDVTTAALSFDGDDTVILACGATNLDLFGDFDEAGPWSGGGLTTASSLQRSCSAEASLDGFAPPNEWWNSWEAGAVGGASLGSHCGSTLSPEFDGVDPVWTLLISEYLLGASPAVELANVGLDPMELGECSLLLFEGGSAMPSVEILLPSGSLPADGTFVICATGGAYEPGRCDQRVDLGDLFFDGDDAILLLCGGASVDLFGAIEPSAPGPWSGGGLTTSSSLRRNCGAEPSLEGFDYLGTPTEWYLDWTTTTGSPDELGEHCGVLTPPMLD